MNLCMLYFLFRSFRYTVTNRKRIEKTDEYYFVATHVFFNDWGHDLLF